MTWVLIVGMWSAGIMAEGGLMIAFPMKDGPACERAAAEMSQEGSRFAWYTCVSQETGDIKRYRGRK